MSSVAVCGVGKWGLIGGGSLLLSPGGVILVPSISILSLSAFWLVWVEHLSVTITLCHVALAWIQLGLD